MIGNKTKIHKEKNYKMGLSKEKLPLVPIDSILRNGLSRELKGHQCRGHKYTYGCTSMCTCMHTHIYTTLHLCVTLAFYYLTKVLFFS